MKFQVFIKFLFISVAVVIFTACGSNSKPDPMDDYTDNARDNGSGTAIGEEYSCGTKQFCTEMNNCDEAMYYYEACNVSSLDGDKDGVPCEELCLQ